MPSEFLQLIDDHQRKKFIRNCHESLAKVGNVIALQNHKYVMTLIALNYTINYLNSNLMKRFIDSVTKWCLLHDKKAKESIKNGFIMFN